MNKKLTIHILYEIKDSPYGGGNQFLRSLKNELIKNNLYSDNWENADIILVNSKDNLDKAIEIAKSNKTIIHRIDGVFSLYRGIHEKHIDLKVYDFSLNFANGTIFQSEWSKKESFNNGMIIPKFNTVINNSADANFFYKSNINNNNIKKKLITSSWSSNFKKGFQTYKFLDENLNFNKYEYVFVGNSPVNFKNIKNLGIMNSFHLGNTLRKSDIFISCSEDDACSNSIIEALSCGLPVISVDSGGNKELVKKGGFVFDKINDNIINCIDNVADNIKKYQLNISIKNQHDVMLDYYNFSKNLHEKK